MRVVDEAILARLGTKQDAYTYHDAATNLTVYDGLWNARKQGEPSVVDFPLPYATFYSSLGDDDRLTQRLGAGIPRIEVPFQFTYVGLDRNQAKAAGERIRARLKRWRPVIDGLTTEFVQVTSSQRIRPDNDVVRPDGSPLFYGVDTYAVGVRSITA